MSAQNDGTACIDTTMRMCARALQFAQALTKCILRSSMQPTSDDAQVRREWHRCLGTCTHIHFPTAACFLRLTSDDAEVRWGLSQVLQHMQDALHAALVQEVLAMDVEQVECCDHAADCLHAIWRHCPACAGFQWQSPGYRLHPPCHNPPKQALAQAHSPSLAMHDAQPHRRTISLR